MIQKDDDCIKSDVSVLKMIVKGYEEQGGGYSQKEALNTAIEIMEELVNTKEGWPPMLKVREERHGNEIVPENSYASGRIIGWNSCRHECNVARLKEKQNEVPMVGEILTEICTMQDCNKRKCPEQCYNTKIKQAKAVQELIKSKTERS